MNPSFTIALLKNLYEICRYEDSRAGVLVEFIPRNALEKRFYMAEVTLTFTGPAPPLQLIVKLDGETIEEAVASWEPRIRAAFEQARSQAIQHQIVNGGKGQRLNG